MLMGGFLTNATSSGKQYASGSLLDNYLHVSDTSMHYGSSHHHPSSTSTWNTQQNNDSSNGSGFPVSTQNYYSPNNLHTIQSNASVSASGKFHRSPNKSGSQMEGLCMYQLWQPGVPKMKLRVYQFDR